MPVVPAAVNTNGNETLTVPPRGAGNGRAVTSWLTQATTSGSSTVSSVTHDSTTWPAAPMVQ